VRGRYARSSDKQKIAKLFAIPAPVIPDFGPSWNVAPQTFQPVVQLNRETGGREIVMMRWGPDPLVTEIFKHRSAHDSAATQPDKLAADPKTAT
jgi:putative SOS response-associated peptidase YedK